MNLSQKIKSLFPTVMLTLVSMLLFGFTLHRAEAQNVPAGICFNTTSTSNNLMKAYSQNGSTVCPAGWSTYNPLSNDNGLCISTSTPIQVKSPNENGVTVDKTGNQCYIYGGTDPDTNEPYLDPFGKFVNFFSIPQYTPPGTGNTNSNNSNTNPGGNGGGTTGGPKPPTQVQGNCDTGFHKTGPICVPNSPFSTGIAGDPGVNTFGGLAIRIIKLLLYFAGIVAVIMAIIGGYQIMTAAGNATQAANGRKTLTNAIIGLVIVILAYVIIQTVIAFVTKQT